MAGDSDTWTVADAEEWERKAHRAGNLAQFFAESPLRDSGATIERLRDEPRANGL